MIGIKGTGMSSLAVLLKKMDYKVTGSDTDERFFTEIQLHQNDISYHEGFHGENLQKEMPDLIITSTAYNDRNPEISQAKLMRIPIISYPQAVGEISRKLISVAVCGSHGKTTTTSMLGVIMETNHETVTLTGTVADGLNTKMDKPKFFVFEADEYQNKFQYYLPANAIVTNIDFDHPDYFRDMQHYTETFQNFATKILSNDGCIIYNNDDLNTREIFKGLSGNMLSFGFNGGADYQITNVNDALDGFTLNFGSQKVADIKLRVYGRHNIMNATASFIMALKLGIGKDKAVLALAAFNGVKRRMELIPSDNYIIIDDYGHHPTEIIATLKALRNKYSDKHITAVFHPHTFTRTKALLTDFGKSFGDVDLTLVLDIYPSAREITGTIKTSEVVKEIEKNGSKAIHTPTIPDAEEYIKKNVPRGSVIITIGAGDVWKLCDLIK